MKSCSSSSRVILVKTGKTRWRLVDRNETFKRRGSLLIHFMANSLYWHHPLRWACPGGSEWDGSSSGGALHPCSALFLHFNLAECIYHQLQPAQALCEDGDIKNSQPAAGRAWLTPISQHPLFKKRQPSLNTQKYLPWLGKKPSSSISNNLDASGGKEEKAEKLIFLIFHAESSIISCMCCCGAEASQWVWKSDPHFPIGSEARVVLYRLNINILLWKQRCGAHKRDLFLFHSAPIMTNHSNMGLWLFYEFINSPGGCWVTHNTLGF